MQVGSLSRHFLAAGAVWLGLAYGFAPRCFGQSSPGAPEMLEITIYKIKPDMVPEWEALVKSALPALKKAGVPVVSFWHTAMFGVDEWVAAVPIGKFAQFDGPSPFVRGLGEAGAMQLHAMAVKCFAERPRSYAMRARMDLSIEGPMNEPPAIAVLTTAHVAYGKGPEFEAFLKNDVVPALKKAGITQYWVHQTVLGGDVNEWNSLTLYKNFADLDGPPPLVKALGQEGADRLAAKGAGIVLSLERKVLRYRADLSYHEAPPQ